MRGCFVMNFIAIFNCPVLTQKIVISAKNFEKILVHLAVQTLAVFFEF